MRRVRAHRFASAILAIPLIAPTLTRAGGVELFGLSSAPGNDLQVDFDLPENPPYEFLLGTLSYAGGNTPLSQPVTATGYDSTLTLSDLGGAAIAISTNLTASNDSEIRTTGRTGRPGATVIAPLHFGDYTVSLDRVNAGASETNSLVLNGNGFAVTRVAPQPGFTLTDVLVNAAELDLGSNDLTVTTSLNVENAGMTVVNGASFGIDLVRIRGGGRMNFNSGSMSSTNVNVGQATGGGTLTMAGGAISTGTLYIGQTGSNFGELFQTGGIVDAGNTIIGNGGTTPLSTYNLVGGLFNVGSLASLVTTGRLNVLGGELSLPTTSGLLISSGKFTWTSGTVTVRGATGSTMNLANLFGTSLDLTPNKVLNLVPTNPLDIPVRLEGGTLILPTLAPGTPVTLDAGTVVVTDPGGFTVAPGTFYGSHLTLRPTLTIGGADAFNDGTIDGNGTIDAPLINAGDVRADAGCTVRFDSPSASFNNARVTLNGGRVEFVGGLFNNGDLSGRGEIVAPGLDNVGNLTLSGGFTDVYAPLTNESGARVILSGNSNVTFWGDVINASGGSFRVSGGSVATFFGAYGGGSVTGGGSLYFEDDVTPGFSPALVNMGGNIAFGPNAKLIEELEGKTRGTEYDAIDVAGNATLNGTIDVQAIGYTPGALYAHRVLTTTGTMAGMFNQVTGVQFSPTLWMAVTYDANDVFVTATVPGDANVDGVVNFTDLLLLAQHYGQSGVTWSLGDFDGTGAVNFDDLLTLAQHYGQSVSAENAEFALAQSVPEPTALVVLPWLLLRRRRRNL